MCMDEEQLNEWAIVPSTSADTLPYDLPDGWVIEEVPRRDRSTVDKVHSPVLQYSEFVLCTLISAAFMFAQIGQSFMFNRIESNISESL